MKVVYVAGKYSDDNEYLVKKNIQKAEEAAANIWQHGHAAICPHLNTAHWGKLLRHDQFIAGDLEIIRRCDALYMLDNWQSSKGAMQERAFAADNLIPCFDTFYSLFYFCDGKDKVPQKNRVERAVYAAVDAHQKSMADWSGKARIVPPWETQACDESGLAVADAPNCGVSEHYEKVINRVNDHQLFITRDSGKRYSESTGAVRDTAEGKGRFDLISPIGLQRLAQLYERGAKKYGDRNWEKGQKLARYIESALRHLNDYQKGDRVEDHMAACAWNCFAFMHIEQLIKDGKLPNELSNTQEAK